MIKLHDELREYVYGPSSFSSSYAMKLVEGGSIGDIYGRAFERDAMGRIVYEAEGDSAGLPRTVGDGNTVKVGNANPVFSLSWGNTFSYKGMSLSVLLDCRYGGRLLSQTMADLDSYGVSAATADARDRGCVMLEGQRIDDVKGFYKLVGGRAGVTEYYMYDATNIRLRELAVSYALPQRLMRRTRVFSGMTVSLVARNLFFIYNGRAVRSRPRPFDGQRQPGDRRLRHADRTEHRLQHKTGVLRIMKRFYIYLFAAFCTVFLGACTGNFRDMNDDLSGISDGDLEADDNGFGYRLQIVQQGIYFNYDFGKGKNWPFQMTQNLNADMFSGYMHDPKPLQGGSHNSDYNLQDGWNSAMWQFTYSYVMPQIYRLEQTAREKMPPFYAITKILKVLAMHRVTDYYGPVIYSHFADRGSEYVPDSQQQVYGCFFDDLDEAADILAAWVEEQPEAGEFSRFDLLLDGSYTAWLRFANSLRMRLAVRIAVAAPEKARAEFRKAAAAAGGVTRPVWRMPP